MFVSVFAVLPKALTRSQEIAIIASKRLRNKVSFPPPSSLGQQPPLSSCEKLISLVLDRRLHDALDVSEYRAIKLSFL